MTVTDTTLIQVRGVGWQHHGSMILDGVDLHVNSGEIVTLIGPNGAGKTTLLKILLGILQPDSGEVIRKPDLKIGYLPQRVPIDPILPLRVSRLLGLCNPHASLQSMTAILAETGVAAFLDAPVQGLSGGEFQRVLLARAMLGNPQLLVLDEPVQGVDYAGEIELYRLIASLKDRYGWGVLLVSHDLHIVMGATDRVICLNHHVCCTGDPDLVGNHPEFSRLFGKHAVENIALYQHHHQCNDETGHHHPDVALKRGRRGKT
ncbi:MAG: metal ABC transporter ATP-binding protein [Magnetococcales bacterium]|nr:metal ABC transporter ATP-binding protein [Magnetococcales bacterium]